MIVISPSPETLKDEVAFEKLKELISFAIAQSNDAPRGPGRPSGTASATPKENKGPQEILYCQTFFKNLSMTAERIEKFGPNREDVARGLLDEIEGKNLDIEPEINLEKVDTFTDRNKKI